LLKRIGFSLLVSACGFSRADAFMPADTSRTATTVAGLDNPTQLNADSLGSMIPVFFCGEQVPVDVGSVARQWRRTLLSYGEDRESLYLLRKRSAQFFPIIEPILFKYRIPRDFRFLPLVESCLDNDCVSPKGAAGYWQLMPATARELGLTVNGDVDERLHLTKATIAVCHYLHQLYAQLRSWTLVAAAYNGGPGHVQERMLRQQETNYFRLRLHRETSQYLFRILACKELFTNPDQYRKTLPASALLALTRPLPRWIRPLDVRSASPSYLIAAYHAEDSVVISPTWGPRVDKSLQTAPSALSALREKARNEVAAVGVLPDADLDPEKHGHPVKKLMGLFMLTFRRPRRTKHQSVDNYRPRHIWDWV
jgi:membrane-bound lytic murein transglycosylase D